MRVDGGVGEGAGEGGEGLGQGGGAAVKEQVQLRISKAATSKMVVAGVAKVETGKRKLCTEKVEQIDPRLVFWIDIKITAEINGAGKIFNKIRHARV